MTHGISERPRRPRKFRGRRKGRSRDDDINSIEIENCELRKECEGSHRLVAQYKAMGKMGGGGYNRPQLQENVRSEMLLLSSILIRVVGCRCCCCLLVGLLP